LIILNNLELSHPNSPRIRMNLNYELAGIKQSKHFEFSKGN
jgi:hypothetical protein